MTKGRWNQRVRDAWLHSRERETARWNAACDKHSLDLSGHPGTFGECPRPECRMAWGRTERVMGRAW